MVCDGNQVVVYYSIAAGSIVRGEALGQIRKNMPDLIPVIILGRLAVDHRCQGIGIGQGLLKDVLARSLNVSGQDGARALNDRAVAFYLKHDFEKRLQIPNTLLLPLR